LQVIHRANSRLASNKKMQITMVRLSEEASSNLILILQKIGRAEKPERSTPFMRIVRNQIFA
jgi:hypothetical protein